MFPLFSPSTDHDEEDEDEELKQLKAKEKEALASSPSGVSSVHSVVERKSNYVLVKVPITPHIASNIQV